MLSEILLINMVLSEIYSMIFKFFLRNKERRETKIMSLTEVLGYPKDQTDLAHAQYQAQA